MKARKVVLAFVRGDSPDCWRAEPRPTYIELRLAQMLMRYHLDNRLAEAAGCGPNGDEFAPARAPPR